MSERVSKWTHLHYKSTVCVAGPTSVSRLVEAGIHSDSAAVSDAACWSLPADKEAHWSGVASVSLSQQNGDIWCSFQIKSAFYNGNNDGFTYKGNMITSTSLSVAPFSSLKVSDPPGRRDASNNHFNHLVIKCIIAKRASCSIFWLLPWIWHQMYLPS